MTGTQNRDFWTEEALLKLQRLFALGMSYSNIGHAMGCTRSAISGQISRLRRTGIMAPTILPAPDRLRAKPLHNPQAALPQRAKPVYAVKPRLSAITAPQNPETLLRAVSEPLRGNPVLIINIAKDGCYWPVSQNDKGVDLFCNEKRVEKSSWCAAHKERAVIRKASPHGVTG